MYATLRYLSEVEALKYNWLIAILALKYNRVPG